MNYPKDWVKIKAAARRALGEELNKVDLLDIGAQLYAQDLLKEIINNKHLLEIGRKAVEDVLVEWRDARLSEFPRGNGLVIRERDGKDSSIIRFGTETALKVGLRAIAQYLNKEMEKTI
uniref:Uncharacterized protein n=1 Tax=viral metagenome TaxID=1070528 RepID=A0A6M3LQF3_9ZZZZ